MQTANITPGTQVLVTDAAGRELTVIAVSDVETEGHSFPVVWVERPLNDGTTDRVAWPASSVRPA
jgi:hypothetical protein